MLLVYKSILKTAFVLHEIEIQQFENARERKSFHLSGIIIYKNAVCIFYCKISTSA